MKSQQLKGTRLASVFRNKRRMARIHFITRKSNVFFLTGKRVKIGFLPSISSAVTDCAAVLCGENDEFLIERR